MTHPPFFIVASPRSGTTLLERLLNRHSRIFIPPETAFFSLLRIRKILGKPYNNQSMKEFIDWYLTRKPAKLLGLNEISNIRDLLLSNANSESDVFVNLLGQLSDGKQHLHVGEKTPHHLKCINHILTTFPHSPVILMIRDGRAVVKSRINQPNWESNIIGAGRAWRHDVERYNDVISGPFSDRVLVVKYEELVSSPEEILRDTCAFLKEEYEPQMLQDTSIDTSRFTKYYQQEWMTKSTTDIDPLCAQAWKKECSPEMIAVMENEVGKELLELGYPLHATAESGWHGLWLREWVRHIAFRMQRWTNGKVNESS